MAVTNTVKPNNVFYVWYPETCRRMGATPLAIIKAPKPSNQTILDFVSDRIKVDEWTPIVNALRMDTSLHVIAIRSKISGRRFFEEATTADKVRNEKKRTAAVWTDYVLKNVLRALACCIRKSSVLSSIELDGLPISGDYLDIILNALKLNKTIKNVSLKRCPVGDEGCRHLCNTLQSLPNVEIVDLTACGLSSISGQSLSKLMKHQQIVRLCEIWHNSLRYEDPQAKLVGGLKRITLNNNPNLGDKGLENILNVLDDDVWIKAIDMQKCSITETMSEHLINVMERCKSLEVADFRENQLSFSTMERIFNILKERYCVDNNCPEYQWCSTATSLLYTPQSSMSRMSSLVQKSKSAPIREIRSRIAVRSQQLKRTRTLAVMDGTSKPLHRSTPELNELEETRKKLITLKSQLKEEISRRQQSEKLNQELMKALEKLKKRENFTKQIETQKKISNAIKVIENLGLNENDLVIPTLQNALVRKCETQKPTANFKSHNHYDKNSSVTKKRNDFNKTPSKPISQPQELFKRLLLSQCNTEDDNLSDEEVEAENLLYNYEQLNNYKQTSLEQNLTADDLLNNLLQQVDNANDEYNSDLTSSSASDDSVETVIKRNSYCVPGRLNDKITYKSLNVR